MKKLFLIILITFSVTAAQNGELRVEHFLINEQLTENDMYDANLGRFDVYELDLNSGDTVNLSLNTESFIPMLILMAPSQEYLLEMPQNGSSEVNLSATIDEAGKWYLYVVGDSTDTGSYRVNTYFSSSNALEINADDDFCTKLNFYIEHSFAGFYFLKDKSIYNFAEAEGKIVQTSDDEMRFTFYSGNDYGKAMESFDKISDEIRECLGEEIATLNPMPNLLNWEKIKGKYSGEVSLILNEDETAEEYKVVMEIKSRE